MSFSIRNNEFTFSELQAYLPESEISSADISFMASGNGAVERTGQSKYRDIVSVKDFGAVGDGITDDTAAFNAAFASSARTVIGVSGDIYVVKDLVINGKIFDGQGCGFRDAVGSKWGVQLTGYNPQFMNCFIQDQGNYAYETTTSSLAPGASTTFSVANATGIQAGDVLFIDLDANDLRWQTIVISVVGNNVVIRDAIPAQASIGAQIVSLKGWLWVSDAKWWNINDILVVNARGALLIKPTNTSNFSNYGTLNNFSTDGIRYFGIAKIENAAGIKLTNAKLWGGYVQVNNHTGNGSAGPFTFSTPVFLYRDVSVYVDNVFQSYLSDWTYASQTSIQFTPGNFPATGAQIRIEHFADGFRGFIEDQRNTAIISGGNCYTTMEILDAYVGVFATEAELTDFQDLIVDTCSGPAIQMSGCQPNFQFGTSFIGFNLINIQAFSCNSVEFSNLYTKRVPQSESFPSVGDNILCDNSTLLINAANWTGGDYQINQTNNGSVNLSGTYNLNFFSGTNV
jgi:hypothetical protein